MGAKRRMNVVARRSIAKQRQYLFHPLNNSRNQALTDHTDDPDWNTVNPERATINRFSFLLSMEPRFFSFSLSLFSSNVCLPLPSSFSIFFPPPPPVSARENGSSSIDRTHRVLPKTRRGRPPSCIDQPFFFFFFFSLSVFVFRLGEYFLFLG